MKKKTVRRTVISQDSYGKWGFTIGRNYYSYDTQDKALYARDVIVADTKKPRKRVRAVSRTRRVRHYNPQNWVITATKHKGGRYYYAGGARLTTEQAHALKFSNEMNAARVRKAILADFPEVLTKHYRWAAQRA